MDDCRHHFLPLAEREIHVREWGTADGPAVILWHGLARTGADFATLAQALGRTYRIIAPDTLGRGLSQWAVDAKSEYTLDSYGRIALALLDHFGFDRVRWVGTSMGGALGLRLAGGMAKERISHLVLNDIGPELPQAAVERILAYASRPPVFDGMVALETMLRTVYEPFGPLSEAEWKDMALTSARRLPDGKITLHYDPRMTQQFIHHPTDYVQWHLWKEIRVPILVLQGQRSDLLTQDILDRMRPLQPDMRLVVDPTCGHAPALNVPAQIDPIHALLACP
jgi:pimeloyl-ACP methyl ester carboxylesterase